MLRKNKKQNTGFTIIEMMIAIAIFLIVVMIGIGALLNTNLIHQKTQNMRSILDNLSFIMEDMSRNIRTGSEYSSTGLEEISFTSQDNVQWRYRINIVDSSIERFIDSGDYIRLTPDEVHIDYSGGPESSYFTVIGEESGDELQPFVTIKLVGTITSRGNVTPFSLQTSVSQRLIDIGTLSSPVQPFTPDLDLNPDSGPISEPGGGVIPGDFPVGGPLQGGPLNR